MNFNEQLQEKINLKTKPLGALGYLEELAFKIGTIQKSLNPKLISPHILVFAADHGIASEGVSAYPSDVTAQMVQNFLNGGAAINVFCQQNSIELKIIDAGVNYHFTDNDKLISQKVALGSRNMLYDKALSKSELNDCLGYGARAVKMITESDCNVIGFGEMGIGNTSSASLLLSALLNEPIEDFTGRGTGVDDEQLQHKLNVLKKVQLFHKNTSSSPIEILQNFGGLEIAQMVGAMQEAYHQNMIILIDGFIATAAFMVLYSMDKNYLNNALFCHQSDEIGHKIVLDHLQVKPILQLNLRVGEGTGCAIAYPIIESAVKFLNEMSSFDDANISKKK